MLSGNFLPASPVDFHPASQRQIRHWYLTFGIISRLHTTPVNTSRPRQNGRHFPDDIFKWIFLNENGWMSINISLKFVPRGPINNIPTLVQIMAWRRPGDKPLFEPMVYWRIYASLGLNESKWSRNYGRYSWLKPPLGLSTTNDVECR